MNAKVAFRDKMLWEHFKEVSPVSVLWQAGPGGMREEPLISSIYLELKVQTLRYVSTLILVQWFSSGESEWRWSETGGRFCFLWTFSNIWGHSWLSPSVMLLASRRDQGHCQTTFSAHNTSPQQRIIQPKMSLVLRLRKTCPSLLDNKAKW